MSAPWDVWLYCRTMLSFPSDFRRFAPPRRSFTYSAVLLLLFHTVRLDRVYIKIISTCLFSPFIILSSHCNHTPRYAKSIFQSAIILKFPLKHFCIIKFLSVTLLYFITITPLTGFNLHISFFPPQSFMQI